MRFTGYQLRAIGYCAKKYDRRLSLCRSPWAYFIDKETNETTKLDINEVLSIYDQGRREDAKERARVKRAGAK